MVEIAVLGFGVVGQGVCDLLLENTKKIAHNAGTTIEVKHILDVRDFPESPFAGKITHDFSVIETDPAVAVVVECIGGAGVAYDFTKRALQAGKSVVSSNKELIATHGHELLQIAKEKGVSYLFEASVGGGVPIIRPLATCLAANAVEEVYGIINGTTNYILSQMTRDGASFELALKEAQDLGYAEQDPTADVEGHDTARKICILASLAFGSQVMPDFVKTQGITAVTKADIDQAAQGGYKIKLLGRAVKKDGKICAFVAPHLVEDCTLLGGVEDVLNAVVVRGNAVGELLFYGPGAGAFPTASAVLADVIACAKDPGASPIAWGLQEEGLMEDSLDLPSQWYVRGEDGAQFTPVLSERELKEQYGSEITAFRILGGKA